MINGLPDDLIDSLTVAWSSGDRETVAEVIEDIRDFEFSTKAMSASVYDAVVTCSAFQFPEAVEGILRGLARWCQQLHAVNQDIVPLDQWSRLDQSRARALDCLTHALVPLLHAFKDRRMPLPAACVGKTACEVAEHLTATPDLVERLAMPAWPDIDDEHPWIEDG